ncbi:DUF4388 domain-containing protein [Catenuloplanes japonicus]|uniref:DUF4388 domain-containing protein n=1 Tax=Catenuloplanes japonicus TaxID=33876 RepID=UPI00068C96EC|nr:DUF4388 domain-containing protein [Catenuloplanes japonicus]
MKAARAAKATLPRRALSQLVNAGETGALYVDGDPGGVIYLTEGQVTYAESAAAPGAGELLTTSGRLSAPTWDSAVSSGKDAHRVGRLLIEQGHLTEGELELCVLGVIYDAAYFVLQPAAVPVRFAAGEQHWFGPVCRVDADVLSKETTRRRRLLDEVFDSSTLDTAPVRPAPRPPVERVVLSALQYELLLAADGERTPATLARLLGRAGFVTLQQVRTLAAAGLIIAEPEHRPVEVSGDTEAPDTSASGGRVAGGVLRAAVPARVSAPARATATAVVDPPARPTIPEFPAKPVGLPVRPTAGPKKPSGVSDTEVTSSGTESIPPDSADLPVRAPATDDTIAIPVVRNDEPKPARKSTGGRRRAGNRTAAAIATENLPRRSPGEQMPDGAGDVETAPDGGPLRGDAPDEALLTRIRSALKALR